MVNMKIQIQCLGNYRPYGTRNHKPHVGKALCSQSHEMQISAGGLADLLKSMSSNSSLKQVSGEGLVMDELRGVREAALKSVTVPRHVVDLIVDLRTFLQDKLEPPVYVSDRRVVKALAMLQVRLNALIVVQLRLSALRVVLVRLNALTLVPVSSSKYPRGKVFNFENTITDAVISQTKLFQTDAASIFWVKHRCMDEQWDIGL